MIQDVSPLVDPQVKGNQLRIAGFREDIFGDRGGEHRDLVPVRAPYGRLVQVPAHGAVQYLAHNELAVYVRRPHEKHAKSLFLSRADDIRALLRGNDARRLCQGPGIYGQQAFERIIALITAEILRERLGDLLGAIGERHGRAGRVALDNGRLKQRPARRDRQEVQGYGYGTRALTEECDIRRVAAERGDVLLHPLHCQLLIQNTVVAGEGDVADLASQEPQRADPVIRRHQDDVLARDQRHAVKQWVRCPTVNVGPAVDVEHDREPAMGRRTRWGPDIQRQTVLTLWHIADAGTPGCVLRTDRPERFCVKVPKIGFGNGIRPAFVSGNRFGKRDAEKYVYGFAGYLA